MARKHQYLSNTAGFKLLLKILLIILITLLLLCLIKACSDCAEQQRIIVIEKTGYLPDDENWDIIPDVDPPYDDDDIDSLAPSVSLEAFFPPIGNQGSYGTCVAWAVGYNLTTALHAIDAHWDAATLANPENQTSPKDLWMSISPSMKGSSCQGTYFEPAFSILINQGVGDMQQVPYKSMGNCNGKASGNNKIRIASYGNLFSFQKPINVQILKAYLCDTVPLAISAHLGDRFMNWNSDDVIDHDTRRTIGPHAYHAMVLVGFDDARHAFRVRNSWGTSWGDDGSIWVDYDFFCNDFCESVFIAKVK